MRESYCIICGEKRDGVEVKNDRVLDAMRWFNRTVLKRPNRNNRIVVCSPCYPKYRVQRKKYLSRQRVYAVLGILFMIFGILIARTIQAFLISLVVLVLLYLLSLLSYMPDLEYRSAHEKERLEKK